MPEHRPLSFTKNLGGLNHLHEAIRLAYRPGTTLREFEARLPGELSSRRLVIVQFFIATRVVGKTEFVVEDALIRTTLAEPYGPTLARLYLFALLLNMPGQRIKQEYRSPAIAQNEYARTVLHTASGWRAAGVDVDREILPWARRNVAATGGLRKFATNFAYFFEQAQFDVDTRGLLITYGNHWAPLALRLFFDRYTIHHPNADLDELVAAAREHEIHRLVGLPVSWLNDTVDGAAALYLSNDRLALNATVESATERANTPSSPAGRRTHLVSRLIRATQNKLTVQRWYQRSCQICGRTLYGKEQEPTIDYAHVMPLGEPHNGPDSVGNLLSLCPNHHRQLDRGGITVEPISLRIIAPHGSAPDVLPTLVTDPAHRLADDCLRYHGSRIFTR